MRPSGQPRSHKDQGERILFGGVRVVGRDDPAQSPYYRYLRNLTKESVVNVGKTLQGHVFVGSTAANRGGSWTDHKGLSVAWTFYDGPPKRCAVSIKGRSFNLPDPDTYTYVYAMSLKKSALVAGEKFRLVVAYYNVGPAPDEVPRVKIYSISQPTPTTYAATLVVTKSLTGKNYVMSSGFLADARTLLLEEEPVSGGTVQNYLDCIRVNSDFTAVADPVRVMDRSELSSNLVTINKVGDGPQEWGWYYAFNLGLGRIVQIYADNLHFMVLERVTTLAVYEDMFRQTAGQSGVVWAKSNLAETPWSMDPLDRSRRDAQESHYKLTKIVVTEEVPGTLVFTETVLIANFLPQAYDSARHDYSYQAVGAATAPTEYWSNPPPYSIPPDTSYPPVQWTIPAQPPLPESGFLATGEVVDLVPLTPIASGPFLLAARTARPLNAVTGIPGARQGGLIKANAATTITIVDGVYINNAPVDVSGAQYKELVVHGVRVKNNATDVVSYQTLAYNITKDQYQTHPFQGAITLL